MMNSSIIAVRRRFNPDFWAKSIRMTGVLTWVFVVIATIISIFGSVIEQSISSEWLNATFSPNWDADLMTAARWMMLYLGTLFLTGFLITSRQTAHKEKKYAPSFRMLSWLAIVGLFAHIVILVV